MVLALILVLTPLIYGGSDHSRLPSQPENVLVFEGTIEKLAPNPGIVSGTIAVYRLARYRVTRVCSGKYEEKEIVIDHLVFDRKEFEGLKVGDRVCVTATISDKTLVRYDAEGIRDPSETINTFYVAAEKIKRVDPTAGCCATEQ